MNIKKLDYVGSNIKAALKELDYDAAAPVPTIQIIRAESLLENALDLIVEIKRAIPNHVETARD